MHCLPAVCLSLTFVAHAAAHAGRPLQSEDADVLDARSCEIEGAGSRLSEPGSSRATDASLELGCGIGGSTQVALAMSRGRGAGSTSDGLRLAGKTALWRGAGDAPTAFTIGWGVEATHPASGGWHHASADLNAVLSVPIDGATVHANLGHARDALARTSGTTWAIAWEGEAWHGWAPMGEFFGDDRSAPWWNLGLRLTVVPDRLFVDLSYGRQIVTGRPTLATLGFKLAF